jgi:hypothetical protein
VDGAVDGALDVDGVDVGVERVVDHHDGLVDGVGLLGADVVDAGELLVGGEFTGARDVRDVGEVARLAAVAEQLGGLACGDGVGELRDRVGVLAFVFLVAGEALVDGEEAEAGHRHVVVIGVVSA